MQKNEQSDKSAIFGEVSWRDIRKRNGFYLFLYIKRNKGVVIEKK